MSTTAVTSGDMDRRLRALRWQFVFLFLAMFLIFGLLAYRTEANGHDLEMQQQRTQQAFYDACLVRQDRQQQANIGRETMVQLAASGPTAPTDPTARTLMVEQLRTALLLPVEDCGAAPN